MDADVERRRPRDGAVPDLGRDRRAALRPRLPARLPPDRQPPRRRGPHPGGLRAGVPLAVDLHARHLRGLAAPDHHQPLPRPGPPQAADPLRRALRRARRPADQRAADARTSAYADQTVRRRRRARAGHAAARTSGPPSCSATSRGCPTRRSPRSWAPSSAPSARGSTAAARMLRARPRPPRARRRAAPATRARDRCRAGPGVGRRDAATSASRVSALARRPAPRPTRPSGPGRTCTPATPAATWSSARAGSRPGWPACPSAPRAAPDHLKGSLLGPLAAGLPARRRLPRAARTPSTPPAHAGLVAHRRRRRRAPP